MCKNKINYERSYSRINCILIFFVFSFLGWLYEVALFLIEDKILVNRGIMHGPWLPIYGIGGILGLLLLKKIRKKPVLTFFSIIVIAGFVEYFTSYFIEIFTGLKYWDYSQRFLNLNGRICFKALIIFGLAGFLAVYIVAPMLDTFIDKHFSQNTKKIILIILISCFVFDTIYSIFNPHIGLGITC